MFYSSFHHCGTIFEVVYWLPHVTCTCLESQIGKRYIMVVDIYLSYIIQLKAHEHVYRKLHSKDQHLEASWREN